MLSMATLRPRKRTYHHGDLRAATLQAASELLEKQGPDAIVLREVARRAGVSHNAPYRHFPDRDALLIALAAEGFRLFARHVQGRAGPDMGEAYVGFALQHPQLFRLMFGGKVKLGSDPELSAASRGAYEGLVAVFRARNDVAQPELAAAAAWSLVHGLAHLLMDGHFMQATRDGAETGAFIRKVMGSVRFASAPQRVA
jgi:AcrR family transcriptional regulator